MSQTGTIVKNAIQVEEMPKKRRYSNEYKKRILDEVDNCTTQTEIGMIIRREGLYSNAISRWKKWRDCMGNPVKISENQNKNYKRIVELEMENARLRMKLKKAEGMIEIQKKISEIIHLSEES